MVSRAICLGPANSEPLQLAAAQAAPVQQLRFGLFGLYASLAELASSAVRASRPADCERLESESELAQAERCPRKSLSRQHRCPRPANETFSGGGGSTLRSDKMRLIQGVTSGSGSATLQRPLQAVHYFAPFRRFTFGRLGTNLSPADQRVGDQRAPRHHRECRRVHLSSPPAR